MPIERDSIINIPSTQVRPASADDGFGNPIPNGDDAFVANCTAGAIPRALNTDPYRNLGGGELDAQRWIVVVRGAVGFAKGDAIVIPTGPNPGKYRAQVIERVPGETLVLAQCFQES